MECPISCRALLTAYTVEVSNIICQTNQPNVNNSEVSPTAVQIAHRDTHTMGTFRLSTSTLYAKYYQLCTLCYPQS